MLSHERRLSSVSCAARATRLHVLSADLVRRRLKPEPERPLPVDPVRWVADELDEFLWSKQRDIMRSVVENRKTMVQSCHGIGKSYIAARTAAWWIAGHPPGEAMVVSTAPSGDQLKIVWGELGSAHVRGALPGSISHGAIPEWTIQGQRAGFGRKPADYINLEQARTQFQGIHKRYLLVIADEAGGVPSWLWQALDTLITNEGSRLLAIGNPDDPTTTFAKMCAPGAGTHVIAVGARDTPNFTGEQVPEQLREMLVSRMWVEEVEKKYGADSAYCTSKVKGQFPDVADDVLISPRLVREAHECDRSGHALEAVERFGMDVARYGKDESVIYGNRGGVIRLHEAWRAARSQGTPASVDTRERAEAILRADRRRELQIDEVGVGSGPFDELRAKGFNVVGFNGGERAYNEERFVNRNSEAWWSFRLGMEAGLIDLDPLDEVLAAQLQSRRWREDPSEKRIMVERKAEMAKRGISSPDRADGAVMAFYVAAHTVQNAKAILERKATDIEPRSIAGDLLGMKT